MTHPLGELRTKIDALDHELLRLLAERIRLVLEVGDYKRARGIAVYDREREREVLTRLAAAASAPLNSESARRIFERIIDESRTLEQHHVKK